ATHGARAHGERRVLLQVVVGVGADVVGEAGDEQAQVERRRRRHRETRVVERRAGAALADEELVAARIVDDAELDDAVALETDADGVDGQAVRVVRRAVERIDDPAPAGAARASAAFLGEDAVVGELRLECRDDERLRAPVAAIRADGLRVRSSSEGESTVKMTAVDDLTGQPPADVVFVTVKAYDTEAVLERARPVVGPETALISLQNGVQSVELIERVL